MRYQNLSVAFSATERYTISQEHTSSEEARRSRLLAGFGMKDKGDRGTSSLLKQRTVLSLVRESQTNSGNYISPLSTASIENTL